MYSTDEKLELAQPWTTSSCAYGEIHSGPGRTTTLDRLSKQEDVSQENLVSCTQLDARRQFLSVGQTAANLKPSLHRIKTDVTRRIQVTGPLSTYTTAKESYQMVARQK